MSSHASITSTCVLLNILFHEAHRNEYWSKDPLQPLTCNRRWLVNPSELAVELFQGSNCSFSESLMILTDFPFVDIFSSQLAVVLVNSYIFLNSGLSVTGADKAFLLFDLSLLKAALMSDCPALSAPVKQGYKF